MIIIDGSYMEGGGQIIRIAVALSAIYKRDITIINIRQGRKTPGLRNQHVACIKSITNITGATVIGNEVKSTKVIIMNHKDITVTNSEIDIKSAGSISLVIQSILPVLLFATKTDYIITIKGGTETYHSPPIDYVKYVLLPTLQRFYVSSTKCELTIIKRGVYPLGGGEVILKITKKCEKVEMKYIPPKLMHHDVWWDEGYVTKKQRKDMPVTILMYKENSDGIIHAKNYYTSRSKYDKIVKNIIDQFDRMYCLKIDKFLDDQLIIYNYLTASNPLEKYLPEYSSLHTKTARYITELFSY